MNITIITRTIAPKWRSTDTVTYGRPEYEECFSADRRARLDAGEVVTDGLRPQRHDNAMGERDRAGPEGVRGARRLDGAAVMSAVTVRIGSRSFAFTSFGNVSVAYRAAIACSGAGCSETPACLILDEDDRTIGYVSYNGRVCAGDPRGWQPGRSRFGKPSGKHFDGVFLDPHWFRQ